MGTKDVRVDPKLNKSVWSNGVRRVAFRVRVRLERKRNEDEDATEKLYTAVSEVKVSSFKGTFSSILVITPNLTMLQALSPRRSSRLRSKELVHEQRK